MTFNALAPRRGTDRPLTEKLFPEGHPLRALVRPTFDSIRRSMAGRYVSSIWVDAKQDPTRAGFRPSYDDLYGPGSTNVMPFISTWMSSGPGDEAGHNTVILPDSIDRTVVAYSREIGVLGRVEYIRNIAHLKELAAARHEKVYSVDDLGEDFDAHSVIGTRLSQWLNRKDDLRSITAFAPRELVKDMYEATLDDYRAMAEGGGRVFLKTNNTESAGAGVFIARDAAEYERQLADIRDRQRKFSLERRICIQAELRGRNGSFQVFLDPSEPDEIQVVAVTDQLVEADGKTYKASVNHPITAASLAHVGPVIVDMVQRIRARHPEAFGFLMSDFFDDNGRVTVYDPGIRPTGNTATALLMHLARQLTGRDLYVSNFHLRSGVNGLKFSEFVRATGDLTSPDHLAKTGSGVFPWGWNDVVGFGVLIGVAETEEAWNAQRDAVLAIDWSARRGQ